MNPTLKEPIVQLRSKEIYLCASYVRLLLTWAKAEKQGSQAVGTESLSCLGAFARAVPPT